ncbi:MAG: IPTL-CTERM sorting domain-containing protein [Burkholderiales bacterium]|uniref:IPTL-CTERM sorting domain-containing protein n=1 Tax=Ottowia sp. TaxID=1898956 RepID=UPI001ACF5927|nr:IPTL-CTERM sorting domain-containing protein [Ottowia sp.]MBN9406104.1 IPTL-CTERM sorting domain-containing protein [Burkholderiales bacterium]MBS0403031.1 IPTL-CTERM sorting domain-containing protein [Pseudomonadota bacterium]HMN56675.1 IPTL-CTERM sorting domain-containing protein [Ottowia sp.]
MVRFTRWLGLGVLLASLLAPGMAHAAKVLYWADSWAGTDYWTPAFALRGDTVTTASSASDLVTQLAAGPWDVVVVSENGNNQSATWAAPVASYIASGGRVVVNNWYNNAALDAATQTSVVGQNQTAGVINAAGVAAGLSAGLPSTSFTLTNAGWGTFSQSFSLAAAGGAQSLCDFPDGSCAVLGNGGHTLRLGFIPDGLPSAIGARLLANALGLTATSTPRVVAPVPTLSQWTLMFLVILLAGMALRSRRFQA